MTKEINTKVGLVPDLETALRIAEAIWEAKFSKATVDRFRPYKGDLADGVWSICGSAIGGSPSMRGGGMPMIEISQEDGRIIKVHLCR